MRNPNAYLALGGALTISVLLVVMVWLIIEQNMAEQYVAPVSEIEPEKPAASSVGKLAGNQGDHLNTTTTDVKSSSNAQSSPGTKPTPSPQQSATDDHRFAVRLYQENAENGDSDAQYKLGLLYLTGNGALQDFAEAAKWIKLSAEQGYGLAQYELGLIYRTGYGLAVDQVQSYVWLNLAAAAGVQEAVTVRDEVMRSLSTKQLAQAQKISREWLAARPKPKTMNNGSDQAEPEALSAPTHNAASYAAALPLHDRQ
ncbi:tetratricopeptide repeat protein [Nitrosovibrio sp. Nv4]|uniref:tetratricopeptide repeat protein n=1 Tax=Nitrosovibrio sp. Nv4 TaxID=1945880 RepID=UPI001F3FA322|nr:tetratricopeptide repeat protein [Nitrosovibrio sp. Nv4]